MWADETDELCRRSPRFAALVDAVGPCTLKPRRLAGGFFGALARSILYQQLAGRAAETIHGRFLVLCDGRPTPEGVLAIPVEDLRGAGLSGAKAASIRDLAERCISGDIRLAGIGRLSDDEIVAELSRVRGIGRWTAEMFLMFQLARPDVWPTGDLGVRKGFALIHDLSAMPEPKELETLGDPFRPYRTVMAWYCWRAVEGVSPPPQGW
jgi:DNA-3-methyladenine glycosylase II